MLLYCPCYMHAVDGAELPICYIHHYLQRLSHGMPSLSRSSLVRPQVLRYFFASLQELIWPHVLLEPQLELLLVPPELDFSVLALEGAEDDDGVLIRQALDVGGDAPRRYELFAVEDA